MTQERTDEDVVRAGLALAFLDTDPRIQPAIAALDRLVARVKVLDTALRKIAFDQGSQHAQGIAKAALAAPIPEEPEGVE